MVFKFWRLPMTGDVRSTGLAGFNNPAQRPFFRRFAAPNRRVSRVSAVIVPPEK